MERLVEHFVLVAPVNEHRVQRPVKIRSVADADRTNGVNPIEDLAGSDRQPSYAQNAPKMHDVRDQPAPFQLV